MENKTEDGKLLDGAIAAGDEWLRKQGVLTDFSVNTIIAWVLVNFPKVKNVDLEVDKAQNVIKLHVYLSKSRLLLLTLLGKRDELLDLIFGFVSDYLPTYEVEVNLKVYKGAATKIDIVPEQPEEPIALGNVSEALALKKDQRKPVDTSGD